MTETDDAPQETPPDDVHLDFDAWADLSARLLQRDEEARLEILAEVDLHPDAWNRCEARWGMEIARDIAAGRMDRAADYGAKCAAELERRKQALETEDTAAEPPPRAAAAPDAEGRVRSEELPAFGLVTATFHGPAPAGAALPFQETPSPGFAAQLAASPAPPPAAPQLTLQGYASLCAELSLAPAGAAETLRRYGVADEAARRALDASWRASFAANPTAQQEWQRLYAEYRQWLLRQPPR